MFETGSSSAIRERTSRQAAQVKTLCADLDPQTVGLADVPAVFDDLVSMKKLIDGAVVRMTSRYEEAGRWKNEGAKNFEDDLARKIGTSRGHARRSAKTSRRLKDCPKTDDALRQGTLSDDQAEVVISGAEVSPEDEDRLLDSAATDPLHETKKKAAQARARADKDREARRRRQHAMRRVSRWIDDDGLYNLLLKVPPEIGAEIDAVLKPLIDRSYADARDAGRMEAYEAYAADVITNLLRGHYTASPNTTTGHDTTTEADTTTGDTTTADDPGDDTTTTDDTVIGTDDPGPGDNADQDDQNDQNDPGQDDAGRVPAESGERLPERARNQAVRPDRKVIGIIDLAALARGHVAGDETCEIRGVGAVPVSAIRDLLGDAALAIVIKDGKDILNVTHIGRHATAHQRTALETRGYQCEVDGCGSTHHLDIDHVTGWTLTKTTRLDDLAWLCRHHHDRKTLEDLILIGPPGRRRLVPRNGGTPAATTATQTALAF